jgi:predicted PurR-regulated permease PerM|tara:strand:+ start:275 stop:535 length:261 start_codon:yes stop_codon:yes gene_type:complete
MFLEISLVSVVILLLTSCYVIWNLMTKLESLEDWVSDFINTIEKMQKDLKEMDYRGSFESDDETGVIFKQIQTTINQLTRFRGEEQ